MNLAHRIGLSFVFLMTGCAAQKAAQDYQRDTIITVIHEDVVYRDTVIYVPVPTDETRTVLPDTDTSHIETMLAESDAWVHAGQLHHSLRQKDMLMPVSVNLPKYIYSKNDSIIRERRIMETVEVEKELSRWKRFILSLGYGLLLSIFIWVAIKLSRKIR